MVDRMKSVSTSRLSSEWNYGRGVQWIGRTLLWIISHRDIDVGSSSLKPPGPEFIEAGVQHSYHRSKTFDPLVDRGSELLPENWNQRPNYSLRYVKDGELYIVVATKSDGDLLVNLLRIKNNSVSSIQFPIGSTVGELGGPLDSLIPAHSAVLNKIQKELVEPVYTGTAREISTQTQPRAAESSERRRDSDDDPLRSDRPSRAPRPPWNPETDPRNIGRSDLDPFSRGGGMIFDPFGPRGGVTHPRGPGLGVPGRLPPGARPPGARFDPFGPPEIDDPMFRRNPDADHLPPPGYDDMFM